MLHTSENKKAPGLITPWGCRVRTSRPNCYRRLALTFSHPDCTVGPGIAPGLRR
jgi:hypothetical protein